MPTQSDLTFFLIVAVIAFALLAIAWHYSRSRAILQKWADDNGYQLLQSEYRWFRKGPFFWTTSRDQVVYHVTVLDQLGRERKGWVRCGSWWFGLFSNKAEVRWDE
jgi:hypothetical protein